MESSHPKSRIHIDMFFSKVIRQMAKYTITFEKWSKATSTIEYTNSIYN